MWNELRNILQDLKERKYLESYVVLLIGVLFFFLNVINENILSQWFPQWFNSVVLAILSLLVYVSIVERREYIRLSSSELSEPFLQHEISSYSDQNQLLSTAHKVFFWGLTFERMIPHVRTMLEKRLQSDLEVRFLVLQPNSNAVRMAAFRDPYQDENRLNTILHTTISDLNTIARNATPPAQLEIRVVDFLPPWTIMAFDPHLPNGQVFVSLLPFRGLNENRATFKLKSKKDSEWIGIFVEQFETIWKNAEPINLFESKPDN